MAERYRGGGKGVTAVRWTGGNVTDVQQVVGAGPSGRRGFEVDRTDPAMGWVWIDRTHSWAACPVGHWVVVDALGVAAPCPPDVFDATYRSGDAP